MFEKWRVIGFRKVNFTDPETKKKVEGFSLYLVRPGEGDNFAGDEAQKIFISSEYVDYDPVLGDTIQLIYNRYGKVSSVQAC